MFRETQEAGTSSTDNYVVQERARDREQECEIPCKVKQYGYIQKKIQERTGIFI